VGLPGAGRTDQGDVGLLDSYIVQVGVGDDGVEGVFVPGIDEALEVVRYAKGKPPFCDVLPDYMLVEVGNQGLGGWDRSEEDFLGRSPRRWGWLGGLS